MQQFCFESKIDRYDRYRIGNASCPKCFRNSCCDSFRPPVHWKQSRRVPPILLRTATARPSERTSDFMQPDSGQLQALLNDWNLKDLKAQNDWLLGSKNSKQAWRHALTTVSSCHAYGCTSPWAITNSVEKAFGPTANDWISHHVVSLFFAAAVQDHDATGMQILSYTKALHKQKWLWHVQTWKIQALFGLEKFTCSQTCIRALKAVPEWKKRNGDDPNPFNLRSKSMRGLDTRITDWLGLETMVWMPGISIDPYQGRSQAENQCVPRIAFRPVRDRLSLRSFIKRQLRPVFLRSQASTHRPKRGFGKNTALLLLVVSFT